MYRRAGLDPSDACFTWLISVEVINALLDPEDHRRTKFSDRIIVRAGINRTSLPKDMYTW